MKGIANIYTNAIHKNLKPLFANWAPDRPVHLGDYGIMKAKRFIHVGNIADLGITFTSMTDRGNSHQSFSSDKKLETNFQAQGEVAGAAKATLDLKFHSRNSVFFNVSGCSYVRIGNKDEVGRQIISKYNLGEWKIEHVVITDIVKSKSTLAVVSSSNNAAITFTAKSPKIKSVELTNAAIRLQATNKNQIGYLVETEQNLSPLFILWKLFWFSGDFEPFYSSGVDNSNEDGDKNAVLKFRKAS